MAAPAAPAACSTASPKRAPWHARRWIWVSTFSLSGIVTFKSAHELHDVAKLVPDDRLLIETDAPYLAPVPYRGKTNTPAYVPHVAARLAELRGTRAEHIGELTSANFTRLFSRVSS